MNKEKVPVKKYLYIFRCILSSQYIIHNKKQSPIEIERLIECELPNELREDINKLLMIKKNSNEKKYVDHISSLDEFILTSLEEKDVSFMNDIGLFFSAFGAVLISVFPFSIVHEYIHLLSYPKKSRKKIIFKMKNLQPIISVESDAKMSKCRTLIMLISPTLVLAIIPIFLSFIIKKLILMTFLIFFGFSSLAMSARDIYFFIVILLKMRNNELFYQEDNKIYFFAFFN